MIKRLVTAVAAILVAATPTVRAFCEAECLPGDVPTTKVHHCPSHSEDGPSEPAPENRCGHDYEVTDSVVAASKVTGPHVQPAAGTVAVLLSAPARHHYLKSPTPDPRGSPSFDRSIPLRI